MRERKVKTLTRNWRDHWMTGTHKHTETVLRYFDISLSIGRDWQRRSCLSKYLNTVSVCLCVPVIQWSLQFLVRVFTFLSLNLCLLFNIGYYLFHGAWWPRKNLGIRQGEIFCKSHTSNTRSTSFTRGRAAPTI